jgi:AcrR family transcriptional regulator
MKTAASKARRAQGDRSRKAILEVAVHVASAEGLEGLTIGRLASETGMSKSGLFAHFGSKQDLQLATIDAARNIFIEKVITPAFTANKGLPRLQKLCEIWFDYVESHVFRGGCFFAATSAEFDSRPGPVRDRIAAIMKEWLEVLTRSVLEAQEAGNFDKEIDARQLAFEINAMEIGANWALQLFDDRKAFSRAREAVMQRLRSYSKTPRRRKNKTAAGRLRSAQSSR